MDITRAYMEQFRKHESNVTLRGGASQDDDTAGASRQMQDFSPSR